MKVNKDHHQVVLSREMYDALMVLAVRGEEDSYTTDIDDVPISKIRWHARKYNTHLHLERKAEVAEERRVRSEFKKRYKHLLSNYSNKQVWQRHPSSKNEGEPVYYKVILLGRARNDKSKVCVRYENGGKLEVDVALIVTEIPEDYVYWTSGIWNQLATKQPR